MATFGLVFVAVFDRLMEIHDNVLDAVPKRPHGLESMRPLGIFKDSGATKAEEEGTVGCKGHLLFPIGFGDRQGGSDPTACCEVNAFFQFPCGCIGRPGNGVTRVWGRFDLDDRLSRGCAPR